MIEIEVPTVTVSEANRRDHWRVKHARFVGQKRAVFFMLAAPLREANMKPPYRVTLTRRGTKLLDSDNLAGAFKAIRDQIATMLDLDDGDERIEWRYTQTATGRKNEFGVVIRIEEV